MADERGDVGRHFLRLQFAEKQIEMQFGSAAIAQHHRSDTHAQKVFRLRHWQDVFGVSVNVNKTRRDDQSTQVDFPGRASGDRAYCRDMPVLDRHVARISRRACAVNDLRMAQDEVISLRSGGQSAAQQPQKKRDCFHFKF